MPPKNTQALGKPRRLLSSKFTPRAKRMMAMNARRSPLLRLPPEIRNRIYVLVLGGKQIHVELDYAHMEWSSDSKGLIGDNENWLWYTTICQSTQTEEQLAKSINSEVINRGSMDSHCDHADCRSPLMPLDLSLLAVSRQIYKEAALIPFTENTFLCAEPQDLAYFVGLLMVPQRQAVRSIYMEFWDDSSGLSYKTERARILQLSCLRSVVLKLVVRNDFPRMESEERRMRRSLQAAREWFERQQLETAIICVNCFGNCFWYDMPVEVPEEWLTSSRETEQALLQRSRRTGS